MKPKTEIDKRAEAASRHLRDLTKTQVDWAKKHLFEQTGFWCGDEVWCSHCGGIFTKPKSERLVDILDNIMECPHCGTPIKVTKSRRQKLRDRAYYSIITTCRGLQVIRTFDVWRIGRKGLGVDYSMDEIVQQWLDDKGARSIRACRRYAFNFYQENWHYGEMSTKPLSNYDNYFQGIDYPRRRIIPVLKRNGYRPLKDALDFNLMHALLTEPKAETLIKSRQYTLLKFMLSRSTTFGKVWDSVKIVLRNRYKVGNVSMWVDYIHMLEELGLDTHSPKYCCPADLKAVHDMMQARIKRKRERQRREDARKRAAEAEGEYKRAKARFFGLLITDGNINIRPLQSVSEFVQEGDAMHHCVFVNEYYNRKDALIMTARDNEDKRIETIEINLRSFKVVQSRGVNNGITPHHDEILSIVNKNINKIKKLAISTKSKN